MTLSKLTYRYLSIIFASIAFISNYCFEFSKKLDMERLMDKAVDFSSISFGFLLAVLALLLQNNSPALQRIIDNDKFQELIDFNKKSVIASAVLAIAAIIYIASRLYISTWVLLNKLSVRLVSDSICLSIFTFQLVQVILFLDLFYFIIKQKE